MPSLYIKTVHSLFYIPSYSIQNAIPTISDYESNYNGSFVINTCNISKPIIYYLMMIPRSEYDNGADLTVVPCTKSCYLIN